MSGFKTKFFKCFCCSLFFLALSKSNNCCGRSTARKLFINSRQSLAVSSKICFPFSVGFFFIYITCQPRGLDSPKRSAPLLFTTAPLGGLKPTPIQRL
jgi:hypothetical protein